MFSDLNTFLTVTGFPALPTSNISLISLGFVLWVTYWVLIFLYRAYLSPLAKFPGPKLAAATFWYEFYYELYPHQYKYLWKIKELHEQYGPIVRINPLHLHIDDPDYYDTIYAGGNRRRDRCGWFQHSPNAMDGATSETIGHDLHKLRRGASGQFFSKGSVKKLEGMILEKVRRLMERFSEERERGNVVNMSYAMSALTMDVISEYTFGKDLGMQCLERKEYGKEFLNTLHEGVQTRTFGRQFPTLFRIILSMPPWLVVNLQPNMGAYFAWYDNLEKKVGELFKKDPKEKVQASAQRTVFHEIRESKRLPAEEKTPERLAQEASVFLGAGTETTARTLSVGVFYLVSQPEELRKLREELRTVFSPDYNPSLAELEALPFLTGCVNEALRLAHGVSSRMPRIATDEDLQYGKWLIPRGTAVMESSYLIHTNPQIYPEPFVFKPERWINEPRLKKYLVAFGAGSRSCMGMNLATSELYICLAQVMRRFDFELFDTNEERDVKTSHDCFIGMTDLSSEGIRVKVVRALEQE